MSWAERCACLAACSCFQATGTVQRQGTSSMTRAHPVHTDQTAAMVTSAQPRTDPRLIATGALNLQYSTVRVHART
jgi:hypothetical protein